MGGCRCTYRNCKVRSDGKTHFFHYPVFDKVRCNQWLNNAGRFDFLTLKVSQLKNRVVCQHHFLDTCFMNNMKDKLTVEAVPTVDGPYCDGEAFKPPEVPESEFVLYPIANEDIENDDYISDRKANLDLKYADYLTNSETFMENSIDSQISQPVPIAIVINKATKLNCSKKAKINIISEKKITEPEKKIPVPLSAGSFEPVLPSMVLNVNKKRRSKRDHNKDVVHVTKNEINHVNEDTIAEILSAADPSKFQIEIDLQEVNDEAATITPMIKNQLDKEERVDTKVEEKPTDMVRSYDQCKKDFETRDGNLLASLKTPVKNVISVLSQSKISPERRAAIDEKRKFNMKLKDIIEAELNKLDNNEVITTNESKRRKRKTQHDSKSESVASSLSILPDSKDSIISYLDARMRKMENLLLNKIDQNTQKIMELKKSFDPPEQEQKPAKMSNRQKNLHDESHKRRLFKEISQYLTPDANSLIYEELFINKFKPNVPQVDPAEPPQKRKRR